MTLAELRALALAATPGPWIGHEGSFDGSVNHAGGHLALTKARDAIYIAACSPDRIIAMLDVIEAADAMRATLPFHMYEPYVKARAALDALDNHG